VEIARAAYNMHFKTAFLWEQESLKKGNKLFAKDEAVTPIREEDAGVKVTAGWRRGGGYSTAQFYGKQLVTNEQVRLVRKHVDKYGLNTSCTMVNLPKSTWCY